MTRTPFEVEDGSDRDGWWDQCGGSRRDGVGGTKASSDEVWRFRDGLYENGRRTVHLRVTTTVKETLNTKRLGSSRE